MKNKLLKYYLIAICFISSTIVLAQPGGSSGTGPGLEDDDEPDPVETPLPIDNYVYGLALVGISLAFIKFNSLSAKQN